MRTIVAYTLAAILLCMFIFLNLVWIHSVFQGKLDFNIFENYSYIEVIIYTVVVLIGSAISVYLKMKKAKIVNKSQ